MGNNKKINIMNSNKKPDGLSRRQFIERAAIGTAVIAATPFSAVFAQTSPWPANSGEITFHMIGHAHIDPV